MKGRARHVFQPDTAATHWDGEQTCATCTLRKSNRVHQVPPVPARGSEAMNGPMGDVVLPDEPAVDTTPNH